MGRFLGNSIARKMLTVALSTTLAALLTAGAALLYYDVQTYRDQLISDLAGQADILARASAPALAFNDAKAARENLSSLRLRPTLIAGAIYRPTGARFAAYVRADLSGEASIPPFHRASGHTISGSEILLWRPIRENKELLGIVVLRGQYKLLDRLANYLTILAVVLVASLLFSALLATRLQRVVTQPILNVAAAARKVIETRDFSQRVHKTSGDEVGVLVDSFNVMLAEVGGRTSALEESNQSLEREMTERRIAQEALVAADKRKDEFIAMLAHELRNPLAPLRNGLEILRLAADDPNKTQTVREIMQRQLNQMVRLVDDLLDVSRITSGRLTLQFERVELNAVLHSALETARPLIEAGKHALLLQLLDEPTLLQADPTRLSQVFSNLLNNAARYTPEGGTIRLTVHREDGYAVVSVSDTGIGLSPESQRVIFGMFVQVDKSLERKHGGLGVGLSLAARLVALHGGTIEARSAGLGKGSEFIVRLKLE
jgi:signal transduction histidine kinase